MLYRIPGDLNEGEQRGNPCWKGPHQAPESGPNFASSEPQRIGSEGGLPLPSAHTTVRTGPYTAVRKIHYLAETCSRRLRSPHCANSRLGMAACICEAPAFHQALHPVAVALRARSAQRPNATSFRYRVLG
jgi:hypothetical protein